MFLVIFGCSTLLNTQTDFLDINVVGIDGNVTLCAQISSIIIFASLFIFFLHL